MKKRPIRSFVSVACAGIALFATPVNATVTATLVTESINGSPHDGTLINAVAGDLIETVGSVANEGGNGVGSRHVTSSLFDGSITTGVSNNANDGDPNASNAAGYYGNNHFIEFDLDTSTNTQGYDISLIQVIQRGDRFRPGINVSIFLRQVGGDYAPLISPPDAGIQNSVNMYAITDDTNPIIASGIDGIRFEFTNTEIGTNNGGGPFSGWTWYRELDVVGEPSGGSSSPVINSLTSIGDGIWELTMTGSANTAYEFRSSADLGFSPGTLIENLSAGGSPTGTIGGPNNSQLTLDGNGQGTVRVTLTGNPSDFLRAQTPSAP